MNEQVTPEQKQKVSRRTLFFLALLFGLPYAAAFYFFFGDAASSLKTSNNGQLISPVRIMEKMSFQNITQEEDIVTNFSGYWTMLTLASSSCNITCTDNLYTMKQVRRAIGVERSGIQRTMLLTDQQDIEQLLMKMDDFSGMNILATSDKNLTVLKKFLQLNEQPFENAIFLFDPEGNYMMYYPPSTHPKLLLEDMQLLIKVSNH